MPKGVQRSHTYAGSDRIDGEEFREGFVAANDGCRLHYQVTGKDSTPDKVRAHGGEGRGLRYEGILPWFDAVHFTLPPAPQSLEPELLG